MTFKSSISGNEPEHEFATLLDIYYFLGYADVGAKEPYRENTLTTIFSSTKGVSAVCVALLVDR